MDNQDLTLSPELADKLDSMQNKTIDFMHETFPDSDFMDWLAIFLGMIAMGCKSGGFSYEAYSSIMAQSAEGYKKLWDENGSS